MMQWWTAIPWVLGTIAIAVSIYGIRRSHHTSIKVLNMRSDCLAKHPDWKYHDYWRVQIACTGPDIFQFELVLECTSLLWYRRRRGLLGWWILSTTSRYRFVPVGEIPAPFKRGQVVTLVLGDHDFRGGTNAPSRHWPGNVHLVAYQSGQRKLLDRSSWRFRPLLRNFDYLCRHPERARALDNPTAPPGPNRSNFD
jgi:hypothetical protein